MWKSSDIKKFSVVGTSCSGKTTTVLGILHHLKSMGISCDGVLQQDRRFAFDREQLEKYKEAQYYFICNQIMRETELTLRGHCEVLVSDRSVLDLYSYYETMYGRNDSLLGMVLGWLGTYTKLYYVEPLPYEDDKQRPTDDFRLRVGITLNALVLYATEVLSYKFYENILQLTKREDILDDILKKIGHKLTDIDLNIIPDIIQEEEVLIGGSYAFNRATKYSDVDVYAHMGCFNRYTQQEQQDKITKVLGAKVEVTQVVQPVWDYLKNQGFKEIKRAKV